LTVHIAVIIVTRVVFRTQSILNKPFIHSESVSAIFVPAVFFHLLNEFSRTLQTLKNRKNKDFGNVEPRSS